MNSPKFSGKTISGLKEATEKKINSILEHGAGAGGVGFTAQHEQENKQTLVGNLPSTWELSEDLERWKQVLPFAHNQAEIVGKESTEFWRDLFVFYKKNI